MTIARPVIQRFMEKIEPEPMSGCWLWTAQVNEDGYGRFRITSDWQSGAHIAAWWLFRGERRDLSVLHKCDVRPCVNPDHLYLGTQKDNVRDAIVRGRWKFFYRASGEDHWMRKKPELVARGERAGHAKLTNVQAGEIRQRYAAGGISQAALGQEYGVHQFAICRIVSGKSYKAAP